MMVLEKIKNYYQKHPHYFLLTLVLLIGLFFRTYAVLSRFEFAHDGDLYSWMVKDIVVNHHLRLIGQETSAPGIFIGAAYYYLIIPFMMLTNMEPTGAIIPITIIAMLTIYSYYWVFAKLFNTTSGLIASFLYAVLLTNVDQDRRVVPSTPTNIWVIWYFYTVLMISRGNYSVLPILAILIAAIWHIHIALLPALIAIPIAMLVAKKLPNLKQIIIFFIISAITNAPFLIFEMRHHFQQTISFLSNFTTNHQGGTGTHKLTLVLDMISRNLKNLFFYPQSDNTPNQIIIYALLLLGLWLLRKKLWSLKDVLPLYTWTFGVITFFALSSSPISEYYFYNIEVIFTAIISLALASIMRYKILKVVVLAVFAVILLKNGYYMITVNYYHKGYFERLHLVEAMLKDSSQKGYPCFGVTYITSPGENVGFRYLFYLKNIHIIRGSLDVPVYNIFIPEELSTDPNRLRFGHIGLVPPPSTGYNKAHLDQLCKGPNTNLTDPMFGYTQ